MKKPKNNISKAQKTCNVNPDSPSKKVKNLVDPVKSG
jgi:hypothetical protein